MRSRDRLKKDLKRFGIDRKRGILKHRKEAAGRGSVELV